MSERSPRTPAVSYLAARVGTDVTGDFARFVCGTGIADLPPGVIHAAVRSLVDWVGCAVGGAATSQVGMLTAAMSGLQVAGPAGVVALGAKLPVPEAALVNGQMGHVLDFDSLNMSGTRLFPCSPVLGALFALAEIRPVSGSDLILALALGTETGVRLGRSAPAHEDSGWHLTGTLGAVAAAAACGKILGLEPGEMVHAIGIGATQSAGLQQNRGTACKSFHAGKAAMAGILGASLARSGFDCHPEVFEGRQGFGMVFGGRSEPERILRDLGTGWAIAESGFKPYPCGIFLHPVIDAMIALRERLGDSVPPDGDITLAVHPSAIEITGSDAMSNDLSTKFSIDSVAALALFHGEITARQLTLSQAAAPDVTTLRSRLKVVADPSLGRMAARASFGQGDGKVETIVPHARGTAENPMTDREIAQKFRANVRDWLPPDRIEALLAMLQDAGAVKNIAEIAALTRRTL